MSSSSPSSKSLPATLPNALTNAQQTRIINIIRRAARAEILPRFRRLSDHEIAHKSHIDDLVTEADKQAEAMITRALKIAFPDALIIGEEAASEDPKLVEGMAEAPLAFHVDPVDGTWNFARGLGVFGVIIAATQFGRPIFGMIYDPLADDWAIASGDDAARLQRPNGVSLPMKPAAKKSQDELTGFVPLSLFSKEDQGKLAAVLPTFQRVTALGCSAHEYRLIAQGHADFVITASLNSWDHAAGALICQRAGCHVEMLSGGEYIVGKSSGVLMVASDKQTWTRLQKTFSFLRTDTPKAKA